MPPVTVHPPAPARRPSRFGRRPRVKATLALLGLMSVGGLVGLPTAEAAAPETLFGPVTPATAAYPDSAAVTVGVRFTARVSGQVTGVRFYKGRGNTGTHVGALYSSTGRELTRATFTRETASGWQSVTFAVPQRVTAGTTLTAATHLPHGHYAVQSGTRWPVANRSISATAGLYRYGGSIAPPRSTYRASNYFVDVSFTPTAPATPPAAPAPTPPIPTEAAPAAGTLDLPRVPWEGGPAYYQRFAALRGTRWVQPDFFPILYWGAYVNERSRIAADARAGINTFGELYAPNAQSARWMRELGITNLGYNPSGTDAGAEWAGHMLPDEADMWAGYGTARWTGRYGFAKDVCAPANEGCAPSMFRDLESRRDARDGRMRYYNGGKGMLQWLPDATAAKFVDGEGWPVDLATGDLYFYTDGNLHGGEPSTPGEATTFFGIPRDQVHRAANYGEVVMRRLRTLDGRDGNRKPLGALVELGQQSGTSDRSAFEYATMTPDRVEGAVWSSLIGEARLVGYFSHAFGTQPTSDALNHPAGDPHYDAVKARVTRVNAQVQALAPVLNTQSYAWTFNPEVSTMLKQHDGAFYVFAMQKRAAATSGTYTFTVPTGMPQNGIVEVIGEGRSLPLQNGRFTDTFAQEFTHHSYRLR